MSKNITSVLPIIASFVLILQFFTFSAAQDIEATITVDTRSPNLIAVKGQRTTPSKGRTPSFVAYIDNHAGVTGIGKRISGMRLFDGRGAEAPIIQIVDGSFQAGVGIRSWSNVADLSPIKKNAASHLSWLGPEGGILIIDDLLPQLSGRSARLKFELPADWKIITTESSVGPNEFEVPNIERTSFVLGRNWTETEILVRGSIVRFVSMGDWTFTQAAAAATVSEIFAHYAEMLGSSGRGKYQIVLHKFPYDVRPGEWEADTRGSTVTIASSEMPFRSQSLQRLHEQLRHEIFHLWIPNGVNLTGRYDWFYEGFALYQSLKLGVSVNRIRFDDYLDTLSRAYDLDSAYIKRNSLIDESKSRWNGSDTVVYARGMLIAFLCDLAMLDASKAKRSTNDLVKELYTKHSGSAAEQDGNAAIIALMKQYKELTPIADRYITGSERLDMTNLIAAAGIEAEVKDQVTRLKVSPKPSGRQKDLLDKLGYNNWRKLANGK